MTTKGKDPGSVANQAMCMMNDEFGVVGWSHSVTYESVDYIDNEDGFEVGVGALVKITLKDGSFHEDVGYGVAKDSKCKGHCIARARRLAANDAFINSVRGFGNKFQDLLSPGKITSYLSERKINKSPNTSPATRVKRKLDLTSNGNDGEEHEHRASVYTSSWTAAGPSKGQKATLLKGPTIATVPLNDKSRSAVTVSLLSNGPRQDTSSNTFSHSASQRIVSQLVFEDSSNTDQGLVSQPQSTPSQAKQSPTDGDKRRRKMRQLELEIAAREKLKTELWMQENSEGSH